MLRHDGTLAWQACTQVGGLQRKDQAVDMRHHRRFSPCDLACPVVEAQRRFARGAARVDNGPE